MSKIFSKQNCIKYIAGLVAVVILVASFMLLKSWENKKNAGDDEAASENITYNGIEYKPKENIETYLVIGLDKYDGSDVSDSHATGVQADFLMLLVFDHENETCTAVDINRDTMTKVDKLSVGGASIVETYTAQIALAYNYVNDDNAKIRSRNVKSSVEYLLDGIHIDHYVSLTMDAVSVCNDFVGGAEVTIEDDFTGIDDTMVKGETITLSGEQALLYVRTRYGLEDSTNSTRMTRQRNFIKAIYAKVEEKSEDSEFLVNLIDAIDDYIVYDTTDSEIVNFAKKTANYELTGIKEIAGETKIGDEFAEFYVDEDSVHEIVANLFYEPVSDEK